MFARVAQSRERCATSHAASARRANVACCAARQNACPRDKMMMKNEERDAPQIRAMSYDADVGNACSEFEARWQRRYARNVANTNDECYDEPDVTQNDNAPAALMTRYAIKR